MSNAAGRGASTTPRSEGILLRLQVTSQQPRFTFGRALRVVKARRSLAAGSFFRRHRRRRRPIHAAARRRRLCRKRQQGPRWRFPVPYRARGRLRVRRRHAPRRARGARLQRRHPRRQPGRRGTVRHVRAAVSMTDRRDGGGRASRGSARPAELTKVRAVSGLHQLQESRDMHRENGQQEHLRPQAASSTAARDYLYDHVTSKVLGEDLDFGDDAPGPGRSPAGL